MVFHARKKLDIGKRRGRSSKSPAHGQMVFGGTLKENGSRTSRGVTAYLNPNKVERKGKRKEDANSTTLT